jgi:hypothetical protein
MAPGGKALPRITPQQGDEFTLEDRSHSVKEGVGVVGGVWAFCDDAVDEALSA